MWLMILQTLNIVISRRVISLLHSFFMGYTYIYMEREWPSVPFSASRFFQPRAVRASYRGLNNYLSWINYGANGPGHGFKTWTSQLASQRKQFIHICSLPITHTSRLCLMPAVSAIRIKLSVVLYQDWGFLVSSGVSLDIIKISDPYF